MKAIEGVYLRFAFDIWQYDQGPGTHESEESEITNDGGEKQQVEGRGLRVTLPAFVTRQQAAEAVKKKPEE